jgi:hypothetical protein
VNVAHEEEIQRLTKEREADIQALKDSRDKWAETARKLGEQLEWANEMACENTPVASCECPGCETARSRAEKGETGP